MCKNCVGLKKIALELLKQYQYEAEGMIGEYSTNIQQDHEKLHAECEDYRRQIESFSK